MTWGDVFTSKNRLLMNCDAASKLAPPARARGDTNRSVSRNEGPGAHTRCVLLWCGGVRTIVAGKGALEVDRLDLLLEEIDLVEEENERSLGEPWAVANLIKQQQRLCSSTHNPKLIPSAHTARHAHTTPRHATHTTSECASKYPLFDSGCRPREASDRTRRGPRRR